MKTFTSSKGFTLIELLVVIGIIAILTGVVLAAVAGSRVKARDGKRISDVSQIQLALEQYYDKCNSYPSGLYNNIGSDCTNNSSITLSKYITTIPTPPVTSAFTQTVYYYSVNSNRTDYALGSSLEQTNAATQDGLPSHVYPTDFAGWTSTNPPFVCNNAGLTQDYCVGPK